ncbi:hypothetical protein FRB93_012324 [Tulasnella sp. JGI-2019a]|nr:hypothetical protein FRB93_012324 [Tulasnella sp. JGI-2019a]
MFFSTIVAFAAIAAAFCSPIPSTSISLDKRSTTYRGQATFFYTGLGACGHWNTNSQPIIALDAALYQKSKACGKWITIQNTNTKKSARGYIVDECPSCGWGSLDLSPSLFSQLAPQSEGVVPISWTVSGGSLKRSFDNSTTPTDDDDDFPPELELTEADLMA